MKAIKYSVIIIICVSLFLSNVAFAQETDNELSELLKYQTNLMKYQAEAKDPGMAALLGGVFGLGLGHYYASGFWKGYCVGEIASLVAIAIGANLKEDIYETQEISWWKEKVKVGEEISDSGIGLMSIGAITLIILRITEPFKAHNTAVEHNKKLLGKYDIDLSLSKLDRSFRLTYRF